MANISFDGAQYNDLKGVRFKESPGSVFYDTTLPVSEAASASDIKAGKKAWVNGEIKEGTHEDVSAKTKDKGIITNGVYYAADDDCEGYRKVTVDVRVPQSEFDPQDVKTVIIADNGGTIEPSPPYTHMSKVEYTVSPNVDANIQPANIREGVPILGVMGTYVGNVRSIDALYFRNNRLGVSTTSQAIKVYYSNKDIDAGNYNDVLFKLRRKTKAGTSWSTVSNPIVITWESDLGCIVFTHSYGTSLDYIYEVSAQMSGTYETLFVLTTTKTPRDYMNESDQDYWHKCSAIEGYNYTVDDASLVGTPNFGNKYDITGTFTPTASQAISGGHIDISTGGHAKAVLIYDESEDYDGLDGYIIQRLSVFALTESLAAGSIAFVGANYKNGTGSVSVCGKSSYPYASSSLDQDATNNSNNIVISDGFVRFKTYGTYAYLVGRTYRYHIYM